MTVAKKRVHPSDRQDQYIVRFPEGMREFIKDEAGRNFRTMNAEIIFRLSEAYKLTATKKADALAS